MRRTAMFWPFFASLPETTRVGQGKPYSSRPSQPEALLRRSRLPQGGSSVAPKELWQDTMAFLASQGSAKIPRCLPRGASLGMLLVGLAFSSYGGDNLAIQKGTDGNDDARPKEAMKLPHLLSMGDSITEQYGPYLEKFLKGVFSYSRVFGGDGSSEVLERLRALNAGGKLKADVLLLNSGLRDIKTDPVTKERRIPIGQYRTNLQQIVALCRQLNVELIWVRTTPVDEQMHNKGNAGFYRYLSDCKAYNAVADEVMQSLGVKSIDLYTFTFNLGPDIYSDGVHFKESVREEQAAYIAGWLGRWKQGK